MQTCAQCGATASPDARWCGQCYLPFTAASAQPGPASAQPASVSAQSGLAGVPTPLPLSSYPPPTMPPPPPPGWAPPAQSVPWMSPQPAGWSPYRPPTPVDDDPGGRLLSGRAFALVAIAIGLGGLSQLAAYLLARNSSISEDTLIRADIVMTLSFYAIVAVLIVSQITPNVRLRWGEGSLAGRIASGAAIGLGLSGVLLALVSAAAGHLYPDQRIVQLMSAGDPIHVVVIFGLTCIAAPLVEETLFRGLLLESLRPRGVWLAIWLSAFAFAIWHFLPTSLIYYTAMGIGLGRLYVRRGMASSMAAHACFNGVLTVAAIIVVLGPAHTYDIGGLSLTAPSGWTEQKAQSVLSSDLLHLDGPGGSEVIVESIDTGQVFDPASTAARITASADSLIPGATIDPSTVRQEELGAVGTAVEANFTAGADRGEMALFALDGRPYGMLFVNGGSAKAEADFSKMLLSLGQG